MYWFFFFLFPLTFFLYAGIFLSFFIVVPWVKPETCRIVLPPLNISTFPFHLIVELRENTGKGKRGQSQGKLNVRYFIGGAPKGYLRCINLQDTRWHVPGRKSSYPWYPKSGEDFWQESCDLSISCLSVNGALWWHGYGSFHHEMVQWDCY